MKRMLVGAVLCVAATVLAAQSSAPASIVIVNGKVWTGDKAKPWAEAVAITGETITAVGSNAEIRARAEEKKTRVIDAAGRVVVPGINDAHMHPSSGMPRFELSLDENAKWSDVALALSSGLDETAKDVWITGSLGPGLAGDPSITRQKLDEAAPGRKIVLTSFTGHGAVLSTAAMQALGLARDAKDFDGGWYGRDANGDLNGRVFEYAQYAVDRKLADMASAEELAGAITNLNDEAVRHGITSVQAMTISSEATYEKALRDAKIPLRVRLMSLPIDLKGKPWLQKNGAIKFILDGTPIERGAALRTAKWEGGSQGRENFASLEPLVAMAVDNNQQLLLHASGDKTVASALNAIAKTKLNRPRIEHGDGMQPDLFPLAKQTGAVVVVNPSHFPFRGAYPKEGLYMPAQSLVKNGIPLAIGSDGPLNPWLNLMFATARDDQPAEALSREEALRAYTYGSAYAEMTETTKGKIAPGFLADIAILSQDIFKVPVNALPETRSQLTIIGGKVVFEE